MLGVSHPYACTAPPAQQELKARNAKKPLPDVGRGSEGLALGGN
jgi:hypothetical protein